MSSRIFLMPFLVSILLIVLLIAPEFVIAIPDDIDHNQIESLLPWRDVALQWGGLTLGLLFLAGLAGGLMSSAQTTAHAAGIGALTGWLTAWTLEATIGHLLAGLWGARRLLAHGLVEAGSESLFIHLLTESVQSIIVWIHTSMAAAGVLGALVGGLGGWLGGLLAGKRLATRSPGRDAAFSLRLSAIMTLSASLNLLVTIAVYDTLPSQIENSMHRTGEALSFQSGLIFALPVGISLVWWLFWVGMTWHGLRRLSAGVRVDLFPALVVTTGGTVYWLATLPLGDVFSLSAFDPIRTIMLIIVELVLLTAILLFAGILVRALLPQRMRDFLARQGSARLIAWMLTGVTLLTLLFILTVRREAWLSLGGLVGLLLGIDTLRRTYAAPLLQEQSITTPDLFGSAFSASFLTFLTVALTSAAPLALVMLPVTMLPYLLPGSASPETSISLAQVLRNYLQITQTFSRYLLVVGTLITPVTGTMLWKLWQMTGRPSKKSEYHKKQITD